ncbi:type III-A CRISPR-associated protein Csm2 [Thermovibrio sp.]
METFCEGLEVEVIGLFKSGDYSIYDLVIKLKKEVRRIANERCNNKENRNLDEDAEFVDKLLKRINEIITKNLQDEQYRRGLDFCSDLKRLRNFQFHRNCKSLYKLKKILDNLHIFSALSCLYFFLYFDKSNKNENFPLREKDIYMPGCFTYKLAEELKNTLKLTQLRKIFSHLVKVEFRLKEIKRELEHKENESVSQELQNKLENIRILLMKIVPLIHYNVSRGVLPRSFALILVLFIDYFVNVLGNLKSSKSEEVEKKMREVFLFFDFIRSLLAYHKYFNPKA